MVDEGEAGGFVHSSTLPPAWRQGTLVICSSGVVAGNVCRRMRALRQKSSPSYLSPTRKPVWRLGLPLPPNTLRQSEADGAIPGWLSTSQIGRTHRTATFFLVCWTDTCSRTNDSTSSVLIVGDYGGNRNLVSLRTRRSFRNVRDTPGRSHFCCPQQVLAAAVTGRGGVINRVIMGYEPTLIVHVKGGVAGMDVTGGLDQMLVVPITLYQRCFAPLIDGFG
jgi:hypothetical protein